MGVYGGRRNAQSEVLALASLSATARHCHRVHRLALQVFVNTIHINDLLLQILSSIETMI